MAHLHTQHQIHGLHVKLGLLQAGPTSTWNKVGGTVCSVGIYLSPHMVRPSTVVLAGITL